jgi:uncharacterized glyoxalase superfamily protein PhnB
VVEGVPRLLDFLARAFGAIETERVTNPTGDVMHAEVRIGDSVVMMGEASEQFRPTPSNLYIYVQDCDETYRRALGAGADSLREPKDEFYGDRCGGVQDPSGNSWWIATRKEELTPEQIQERARARAQG